MLKAIFEDTKAVEGVIIANHGNELILDEDMQRVTLRLTDGKEVTALLSNMGSRRPEGGQFEVGTRISGRVWSNPLEGQTMSMDHVVPQTAPGVIAKMKARLDKRFDDLAI